MNSNSIQRPMENSSTFENQLQVSLKEGSLNDKLFHLLMNFYKDYKAALDPNQLSAEKCEEYFICLLKLIKDQYAKPFVFNSFHQKIRSPFDYYTFGKDFLKLVVDQEHSTVIGKKNIEEVIEHLKKGHNVILFSNHQVEADPQAISLLLDDQYPGFAENMIFVAGNRVVTDPFAIPFSMGRNLICIYSKKHIDHPPEKKAEKQSHNKKTMKQMSLLLKEGNKCIYVAPSGGRDRKNSEGVIEIAPFDSQSIEMFYLMAKKAQTPTYFYPLSLSTYDVFPPPPQVEIAIGEARRVQRGPIHLNLGPCIDMEKFSEFAFPNKELYRQARADYIWNLVNRGYQKLIHQK